MAYLKRHKVPIPEELRSELPGFTTVGAIVTYGNVYTTGYGRNRVTRRNPPRIHIVLNSRSGGNNYDLCDFECSYGTDPRAVVREAKGMLDDAEGLKSMLREHNPVIESQDESFSDGVRLLTFRTGGHSDRFYAQFAREVGGTSYLAQGDTREESIELLNTKEGEWALSPRKGFGD